MPAAVTPLDVRIARKIQAPPWSIHDDVWAPFVQAPLIVEGVTNDEIERVRLLFGFSPIHCWIWIGAYSHKRGGYRPAVQLAGRGSPVMSVLRLMLCLRDTVPLDLRDELQACHGPCDNPKCVNPFHAYWGTSKSNHDDRRARQPWSYRRKELR